MVWKYGAPGLHQTRLFASLAPVNSLQVVSHPLAQRHLTALRAVDTSTERFGWHMNRLAEILFLEASRELAIEPVAVQTPLAETEGVRLARPIVLCPILRAGLGFLDAVRPLVPEAHVAHIGLARDEATAKAHAYYGKFPDGMAEAEVFLLDPMLATGGSAVEGVRQLRSAGAKSIHFVCVVSCPQGIEALQEAYPEVPITTAAVDAGLNLQSYIVPGLGDAGDRYFGT